MAKLVLLSVLIMTIALPIAVAERPKPQLTLRWTLVAMVVLILIWAQLCLRLYPELVPLDKQ
jgi:hypothetical protein